MEFIEFVAQFDKMIDNRIIGMPNLINSKINFRGKNNILVCDNNIKIENSVLDFNGDNSLVYICSDLNNNFNLVIYNNSTLYVGKDVEMGCSVNLSLLESRNLIIGDDCVIKNNVHISNSVGYSYYNSSSKDRLNFPMSVFIGDHVFLGDNAHILNGVKIGSGSIIGECSVILPYSKIPSNVYLLGNPAKIIKNNVFFTKDFTGSYLNEDIASSKDYKSNIFIYEKINQETLSFDNVDKILNDLDVESRRDFIHKLFVKNKRKNRFTL